MNRCSPPSSVAGSGGGGGSGSNTPAPPQFAERSQPAADEQRISPFSSSPPRRETANKGYFLDSCALCKLQISQFQDRYMYGYLQAFCSIGCRDVRVTLDELANPPSPIRCPNVSC